MKATPSFEATRTLRAGMGAVLLALSSAVWGDDEILVPPGYQWGPIFVAPSLAAGLFVTDNPFFRSTDSIAPGEDIGDIIAVANPAVVATIPFRNSWFRIGYDGVFRNYGNATTASNNAQDIGAELSLFFATFDRLGVRADWFRGAADTIRFDGGEAVYDGTPYTFNTYEVDLERQVPGRLGYAGNLRYSILRFDSTDYSFFDYDGYEGAFEIRGAVSPSKWILGGGMFRRYDHRLANDPTHSVYRREITDALLIGAQGIGAHAQSWRVVLRFDRADYPGGTGSNFRGLGGEANLILAPGPTSSVNLYASRRNWSSFYETNNFYLASLIGVRFEKRWSMTSVGLDLNGAVSDYPDAVIDPANGALIKRRDFGSRGELYANFLFRSAYSLRVSYVHQGRHSNAGGVDYRANSLGVQFVLGWR